ncbi:MAG: RlmE family RNA methyltransferase [Thaumarchaeota archaeon]|nr:RlmE family RNA methyltransferase [Nitrososphaerota archaeon]
MRLREAKRDLYRRLSKEEGYRSRAYYKLSQINSKYSFMRRGQAIIDFGAAPGGWLEASSKLVGGRGMVIGVDIDPISPVGENVRTLVGNVRDPDLGKRIITILGRSADIVLSDISQKITGIWEIDHSVQIDMTLLVIGMLPEILKTGGVLLAKAFDGPRINELRGTLRERFRMVRIIKPPASRQASSEVYFLNIGYQI